MHFPSSTALPRLKVVLHKRCRFPLHKRKLCANVPFRRAMSRLAQCIRTLVLKRRALQDQELQKGLAQRSYAERAQKQSYSIGHIISPCYMFQSSEPWEHVRLAEDARAGAHGSTACMSEL